MEELKEFGKMIISEISKDLIANAFINYSKLNIFNWINKTFNVKYDIMINYDDIPFEKEKIIINIDMPYIYNNYNQKRIDFYITLRNFNISDIIIKKINIEICKDARTVLRFEKSLADTEFQNKYNWQTSLTEAEINNIKEYFIEYPNSPKFYISKGEFDFNFKIFYRYQDQSNDYNHKLNQTMYMVSN